MNELTRRHNSRRGFGALMLALVAGGRVALGQDAPAPEPPPVREGVQTPQDLQPYEGRPVSRVIFLTPGKGKNAPNVALDPELEKLARNQIRLREGIPFAAKTVTEDISRLNRVGRFKSIESRVQQLADGSVELAYFMVPQPVVTAVQTVGNREFSDEELQRDIDIFVGTPVDSEVLGRACRKIEEQYRAKGYFNTLCTVDQAELEANGIVLFKIREGDRTAITDIRFEGVKSFNERQLRSAIKTTEAAWLRFIDRGEIDNDKLDDDVANIIDFYKDRGYIDVRADRVITPSPDGKEAIVTFIVDEGRVYTLRNLALDFDKDSDPVFSAEQLQGLMLIKPGDQYSEKKLKDSIKAIQDAYGTLGYVDARVARRDLRDGEKAEVDIRLGVRPGRRFKTGNIEIQGNSGTKDHVIRRQMTLAPDRPLDTLALEESKKRIENTRLFGANTVRTTILPERDDEPGYRDVLVEVGETNTGSFNVGAGITSDSGLVGQISLSQRNFDITDVPDSLGELFTGESFHGGGQTLSLNVLPGTRSQYYSLSLSDPYVFDTNYSASGEVYFRKRQYVGYDEQRYGAKVTLGRRFGSQWTIGVPVRAERVELTSIDSDAPTDFFAAQDAADLGSVGVSLVRSSVDNFAFPSKGSKIEFDAERIFGDYNFTKLNAEYTRYFKLDEDVLGAKTTLKLTGRVAYIPEGQGEAPFYERYYLGGESFRGFGFRGVAPGGIRNDNGQPANLTVGGTFLTFLGAEVRRPILTDVLSVVGFVDSGTVNDNVSLSPYRLSVGAGLRIYVPNLSPAPLAFDFGFPIIKESTDQKRLFTFSIDVPFR
ncbi:MAG: outer membrane protein assembly factor BamA [Tepidisphaera sp.]|nr:outer membrane protein assembly factor BamA [Tepidisphaera sp.]